jgi:hypothetical protein
LELKIAAIAFPEATLMEDLEILKKQVRDSMDLALNIGLDPKVQRDNQQIVIKPLQLKDVTLARVLEALLQGPKLSYVLSDKVIYISSKEGCAAYMQYVEPAIPEGQAGQLQKTLNATLLAISLPGVSVPEAVTILKTQFKDLTVSIDPALLAKQDQISVTVDLRDVPLRVVLKNMLAPIGLEYTIVGEGIYIQEKAPTAATEKPK